MDRKTFNQGTMDLLSGIIIGLVMHFSLTTYLILFCLAVLGTVIMLMIGQDVSDYGDDIKGHFSGWIVARRILIVNIGVVVGLNLIKIVP